MTAKTFDNFSQADLTLHHCQVGYEATGSKLVVAWCRRPALHGFFELQQLSDHKTLFSGPLRSAGLNLWGWHEWVADLTEWQEPGQYRLWVTTGSGYMAETNDFRIVQGLHEKLAHKAAKHIHKKRCGVMCHPHDAWVRSQDQATFGEPLRHVDVSGGWHDACDDSKWIIISSSPCIEALADAWHYLKPDWKGTNEPLPYALAEAWWGVEWMLKMLKPDGSFYYAVLDWKKQWNTKLKRWCFLPWAYDGFHEYDVLEDDQRWLLEDWGSGVINDLMGIKNLCPSTPEMYHALAAAAILRFAEVVRYHDPACSDRCVAAGKSVIGWLEGREIQPFQWIYSQAALARAWMSLHQIEKQAEQLAKAEQHLGEVLALQNEKGWFHTAKDFPCCEMEPSRSEDRVAGDYAFNYVLALLRYIEVYPEGRLHAPCREALTRFFAFSKRLMARSGAFQQLPEYTEKEKPEPLVRNTCHGFNAWFLLTGILMAMGSRLLGDPELRRLAERQVHWVLGANPRAMSFMIGIGNRRAARNPLFVHADGRDILWGITTGVYVSGGAADFSGGHAPADFDPDFVHAGRSVEGGYDAGAEESWLTTTGWFLAANVQLSLLVHSSGARNSKLP